MGSALGTAQSDVVFRTGSVAWCEDPVHAEGNGFKIRAQCPLTSDLRVAHHTAVPKTVLAAVVNR